MSSPSRSDRAAGARKTFRPQLWSWSRSPLTQPTRRLKIRDGRVLCQGSSRGVFQPLTTSAPARPVAGSARRASMAGISAGSSWPSPSSITIRGLRQRAKPSMSAADFPSPRGLWIPTTRRSPPAAEPISPRVVSLDPSSMTNSSQASPAPSSTVRISAISGPMFPASLRTGTTSETSGGVASGAFMHSDQTEAPSGRAGGKERVEGAPDDSGAVEAGHGEPGRIPPGSPIRHAGTAPIRHGGRGSLFQTTVTIRPRVPALSPSPVPWTRGSHRAAECSSTTRSRPTRRRSA